MKQNLRLSLAAMAILASGIGAAAQGTAFTYQGRMFDNGTVANGNYDMQFYLRDALAGGNPVDGTNTIAPVAVSNGLFTVTLDFGAVFTGSPRWLVIAVRTNGSVAAYTALSPRQPLTPTPYAITSENLNGTLGASQLTGTLPGGLLLGTYPNALTLNNSGNSFTGNGAGLLGLNASALASGTVPDGRLSPNVALLDRGQTFTGANIFDRGTGGSGRLIVQGGFSAVDTTPFTGLGFQYNSGPGEGAIISSYADGFSSLSFYTKAGSGLPVTKQMMIDLYGVVAIDQGNYNDGFLNNGNTNGAALTFGVGSGEGIGSKRTPGGNQYGLDFYTGFTTKMSIGWGGFVGIGRQTAVTGADIFAARSPAGNGAYGGMYVDTAGSSALPFYGYSQAGSAKAWTYLDGNDGNKWKLFNNGVSLTVTTSGAVGIGTTTPTDCLLDVEGDTHINDHNIFLRPDADRNHGIGYRNTVAGIFFDGPFVWGYNGGALGTVGPDEVSLKWDYSGNVWVSNNCSVATLTIRGGADLAEPFELTSGQPEVPEGAVVVIDEKNPGHLKMSYEAYDKRVAGVVSGANGIQPGIQMHQQGILEGGKNIALTGRVYVQADASSGPIKPGDQLTTSSTPGHAMRAGDSVKAQGAILGKAMTALESGRGTVLVLVTLQ